MKTERLEPLSDFSEDEAIEKIINLMMRIYLRRADEVLKLPNLRFILRGKIKEALTAVDSSHDNLLQNIADKLTGEVIGPEPEGRFAWGWQDKFNRYQVRKLPGGRETMVVDSVNTKGWK